jgi:hypothetical protein
VVWLRRGAAMAQHKQRHGWLHGGALTSVGTDGLSVICVQKVPLRKVGKINQIAPRAEFISLI